MMNCSTFDNKTTACTVRIEELESALRYIIAIGYDYDGHWVDEKHFYPEGLKVVIDELVDVARDTLDGNCPVTKGF